MKETVNVSIASQAFILDQDAYNLLSGYLHDIKERLGGSETDETYADIEARIAEIFRERVPSPMMVITYGIVRNTMNQIGSPENFGVASRPLNEQTYQQYTNRLYRSRKDRSIAGICSGIAKYFGLDTTLVRIAAILCIFFAGATLWIYLILWLVLPYEPEA